MSSAFRKVFKLKEKITKWYPGHMTKGMRSMQRELKNVDAVIEIHDARIPFSGRNPDFRQSLTSLKPHILVLNKCDLTDMSHKHIIEEKLLKSHGVSHVIFTQLSPNAKARESGYDDILPSAFNYIKSGERFNRADTMDFTIMVIGVPNVGKSSFINKTRHIFGKGKNAAVTGPEAGVTKHVMEKIKVSQNPRIYLLDTPGILEPKCKSIEQYMKLAAISSISDESVGRELIADYILFWMNKHGKFGYVDVLKLDAPTDNISEVFFRMCVQQKIFCAVKDLKERKMVERPDFAEAARRFILQFRSGHFGKFLLDCDDIQSEIIGQPQVVTTDPKFVDSTIF